MRESFTLIFIAFYEAGKLDFSRLNQQQRSRNHWGESFKHANKDLGSIFRVHTQQSHSRCGFYNQPNRQAKINKQESQCHTA